jgi:hypothetical protein
LWRFARIRGDDAAEYKGERLGIDAEVKMARGKDMEECEEAAFQSPGFT